MNIIKRFLIAGLWLAFCAQAFAQVPSMDTALSKLADNLSAIIKANGNKKVTVLDFTDLQDNSSELGRYIAEELTVDMVMGKHSFAVLDRANLKSILAEHKLTAKGLVNPDNAKKLGQFAGVDALIIGNVIPMNSNVELTVKIITTDTAEIIGAAKSEFRKDGIVEKFLANPATTHNADEGASNLPPGFSKPFGDLAAKVTSLRFSPGTGYYGSVTVTLIITNTSPNQTYAAAINPDYYHEFSLSNGRGDICRVYKVSGIDTAFSSYMGYHGNFTEIPPHSAITLVAQSQVGWHGSTPGDYRPYHLQTEVVFGPVIQGRLLDVRKYNLVRDIK